MALDLQFCSSSLFTIPCRRLSPPVIDLSIRRGSNGGENLIETATIIQRASKHNSGDPSGIANVLKRVCLQEHEVSHLAALDSPDRIRYAQEPGGATGGPLNHFGRRYAELGYEQGHLIVDREAGEDIQHGYVGADEQVHTCFMHLSKIATNHFLPDFAQGLAPPISTFQQLLTPIEHEILREIPSPRIDLAFVILDDRAQSVDGEKACFKESDKGGNNRNPARGEFSPDGQPFLAGLSFERWIEVMIHSVLPGVEHNLGRNAADMAHERYAMRVGGLV